MAFDQELLSKILTEGLCWETLEPISESIAIQVIGSGKITSSEWLIYKKAMTYNSKIENERDFLVDIKDEDLEEKALLEEESKSIIHDLEINLQEILSQREKPQGTLQKKIIRIKKNLTDKEIITEFKRTQLEPDTNGKILSGQMYKSFRKWCDKKYSERKGPDTVKAWGKLITENEMFVKKHRYTGESIIGFNFK